MISVLLKYNGSDQLIWVSNHSCDNTRLFRLVWWNDIYGQFFVFCGNKKDLILGRRVFNEFDIVNTGWVIQGMQENEVLQVGHHQHSNMILAQPLHTVEKNSRFAWHWTTNNEPVVDHRTTSPSTTFFSKDYKDKKSRWTGAHLFRVSYSLSLSLAWDPTFSMFGHSLRLKLLACHLVRTWQNEHRLCGLW